MLYLVIFLLFFGLIAILIQIRINIVIEYIRNKKDDHIVISFFILKGIFKYKYEIPMVDFGKGNVKFKLVKEHGKKDKKLNEKKERLKLSEIYEKVVLAKEYYEANKKLIKDLFDRLKEKIILDDFHLYIKEGTGNACYTAMLYGLIWSLTGMITSFLHGNIKVTKKSIAIIPCFKSKVFKVDLYCIFHIKFVHIIKIAVRILFNVLKEKQKIIKETGGDISG